MKKKKSFFSALDDVTHKFIADVLYCSSIHSIGTMKFAFVIALTVVATLCCVLFGLFGNDSLLLSARRMLKGRVLTRSNSKWAILSSVFGTQMEYTFGGEETFEYAHPDPITAVGDGYRVRCTDYDTELPEG